MTQPSSAPLLTTSQGRLQLLNCYQRGLLNDTLEFWFPRSIDTEHGGFLHCVDRDGTLLDSDKSVWAQGRMVWMLFTLYNTIEPRADWLAWAQQGLEFLEKHCFDTDGRMFFHVTRTGEPIRKRRYAFSESFAAIAYAASYGATRNARHAERAIELFDFFTRWNFTPGLMPPKHTHVRPLLGMGPRMITIITAQDLRGYLGDDPRWTRWIDRCVEEIERWFVKRDLQVVLESVGEQGEIVDHFDGRLLNPGHAMEGAWFIMQEGRWRNDARLMQLGCDMFDWMWQRGWDDKYGGIFYFRDVYNRPVQEYWHDMKFWWPHDEAIIAALLAYEISGDVKFAQYHQQVHDWSHAHFADPEYGEWYGYLHRDGSIASTTKGNLWKSCFHHPRMQWFCAQVLAEKNRISV